VCVGTGVCVRGHGRVCAWARACVCVGTGVCVHGHGVHVHGHGVCVRGHGVCECVTE